VIDDGSTDGTKELLETFGTKIIKSSYVQNKGKGYALAHGFKLAEAEDFTHAITMDSDGQHPADDIPAFLAAMTLHPNAMIVGSRRLKQKNMPKGNTFANHFSNFWFFLQTGKWLPDTQTGFRLYPLKEMKKMRPFTSRYEAELEFLVRIAWRNIPIISIPIHVHYPEKSVRITHFRPFVDFLRISLLNTALCLLAIIYGYPAKLYYTITNCKRKR
jgi:glycosyltransferase involved in cell wall biosynthesis